MLTLYYEIVDEPCLVRVDDYTHVGPWRGSPRTCPSEDDYYGYEEIHYTILSPEGDEDPGLEKLVTEKIDEDILQKIRDLYEESRGERDE